MFQSLKSPVLLTFLKCYFTVITVFVMRDLFSQMELFAIGPVRLWEREKGLWLTCSNPLHTWSDNYDQTGRFFLKTFHSRQKKSSPAGKCRKEPRWQFIPEFILGCAAQFLTLGRAVVEHIPAHEGGKCALHKCRLAKFYGLWGSFGELCLYYGWAKVQALCFFFFPKKGKPQKETEMKRKQVNKCGFTETEGQFILSTASKNLENIWKSQKTS